MSCRKCGVSESADDPCPSCDRCATVLCKTCADLSTTEMRAVTMKNKRSLIFLCPDCRPIRDVLFDLATFKDALLHQLLSDFSERVNSLESRLMAAVRQSQQEINDVSNEVSVLRQSNVDLVRLFTNGAPPVDFRGPIESPQDPPSSLDNRGSSNRRMALSRSGHKVPAMKSRAEVPAENPAGGTSVASAHHRQLPLVASSGNAAPPMGGAANKVRPSVIVGSRKIQNSRLTAANIQKKTSVLVSRLDGTVTSEYLLEYLQSTFGATETFNIEEQKVRSGDYRSYRVEARVELLDRLLCADSWPEGVLVRRFRFPPLVARLSSSRAPYYARPPTSM